MHYVHRIKFGCANNFKIRQELNQRTWPVDSIKTDKEITGMLAYIICAREMKCGSVHSKCLLLYYAANCDRHGSFFKSMVDICAETGLSESFVRKTNAYWEKVGIMSSTEGNWAKHLANRYHLHLTKLRGVCAANKKQVDQAKVAAREKSAQRSQRYRSKKQAEANQNVTPPQGVIPSELRDLASRFPEA
jgi:hypothetical protein